MPGILRRGIRAVSERRGSGLFPPARPL